MTICAQGVFQVSAGGAAANRHTGAAHAIPAMSGASDPAIGARKTCVMMDNLSKTGEAGLVSNCNQPLTGLDCVSRFHTDLAVIDLQGGSGMVMTLTPGMRLSALPALSLAWR